MTESKSKLKYFKVNIPIYSKVIHFYLGSFNEIKKGLYANAKCSKCKKEIDELEDTFKGITIQGCNGISIALIKDDPEVVAHEIFHACTFILDQVGITFADSSEEAYAYLIGYITKRYYNYINNLTNN